MDRAGWLAARPDFGASGKDQSQAVQAQRFDKDRIATVSDWDGGELATLAGDCNAGLSLRADAKASAEKIGALSADKEYSSSDPAIRATKPTISEILIGY